MSMVYPSRAVLVSLVALLAGCGGELVESRYEPPADVRHAQKYETNSEGLRLFEQTWLPSDAKPRGMLLLVHGTGEHTSLYAPFAELLARSSYGVRAVDLQGWGRSAGKGARGYVESHTRYLADLAQTLQQLRAEFPRVPIYGAGESLGGMVLLRGQITGELELDGLLLSDAGYKPRLGLSGLRIPGPLADIGVWVGGVLGRALPHLPLLASDLGMPILLCSKATLAQFQRDPFVSHNWLPAAYVSGAHESMQIIEQGLARIDVPMLAIHGDEDALIPVESSQEIVTRGSHPKNRLLVIEGGCHASFVEERSWRTSAVAVREFLDDLDAEKRTLSVGAAAATATATATATAGARSAR